MQRGGSAGGVAGGGGEGGGGDGDGGGGEGDGGGGEGDGGGGDGGGEKYARLHVQMAVLTFAYELEQSSLVSQKQYAGDDGGAISSVTLVSVA